MKLTKRDDMKQKSSTVIKEGFSRLKLEGLIFEWAYFPKSRHQSPRGNGMRAVTVHPNVRTG